MQRHQTLARAASFCEIFNLRALILMAPMAGVCAGKALPLVPREKLITQQPSRHWTTTTLSRLKIDLQKNPPALRKATCNHLCQR